ncbi:vancomycin high temperature exclusion protein [Maribacter algarum]|uniref:Vancomycin high temperature exclusion protein n=1 Tax=Maribacter algarum (ex Zhang et al. 2020) TaxID=2578118 RepID=A0A5S3PTH8_9FLAO|nr:ElyC/SanA/YdcF family protein [Maribacter algarum]TMM58230.1 vancomycin high temperature exclusion protein [Maribacter algarum]
MKKKYFRILLWLTVIPILLVLLCNFAINSSAEGKTFSRIEEVPKNKVGLVLGTAKKLSDGRPNLYYSYRIMATVALFEAGKIEFVLVSGDNGTQYYNEPTTIKKDLIAEGIPQEKIFLDYAGFRTLDSMVRAKEVFGLEKATVISQKFHNQRAIYIAERKGLTAIGFNATDVTGNSGLKVHLREYLARVKVFIDLIFNTQPKFYGERIEIR